jgi:hypothetical protein
MMISIIGERSPDDERPGEEGLMVMVAVKAMPMVTMMKAMMAVTVVKAMMATVELMTMMMAVMNTAVMLTYGPSVASALAAAGIAEISSADERE